MPRDQGVPDHICDFNTILRTSLMNGRNPTAEALLATLGERVFVTDFDGTMTGVDFFDVVLNHVAPGSMDQYWERCIAGELTHVAALNGIFQNAPRDIAELRTWLPETKLDPATPRAIHRLRQAGWDVLVVSAGCEWYIEEILAPVREQVHVIANPGDVSQESGLWMGWPPADSPWYSAHFGVDKGRLVQLLTQAGKTVAFAGDGRPDLAASREVAAERRFAKSWLADQLAQQGLAFRSFVNWSEIAPVLTGEDQSSGNGE
ncbi:MAG: HAD-IB family phosphatase [Planctomycetaceae bacterium]|nr:HAD-IB family phosphatase [Planctomycetaceae bacterium]